MASTLLNEQGWHPDLIELQLAHAERNKVRAADNKAQRLAERRKMMQAWADYIDGLKRTFSIRGCSRRSYELVEQTRSCESRQARLRRLDCRLANGCRPSVSLIAFDRSGLALLLLFLADARRTPVDSL